MIGEHTFSSSVSRVRAAFRILDKAACTRQSSRLFRSPNSPTVLSSASRRSFSKGRLGLLNVLLSASHQNRHGKSANSCGFMIKDMPQINMSTHMQSLPKQHFALKPPSKLTIAVKRHVRHGGLLRCWSIDVQLTDDRERGRLRTRRGPLPNAV